MFQNFYEEFTNVNKRSDKLFVEYVSVYYEIKGFDNIKMIRTQYVIEIFLPGLKINYLTQPILQYRILTVYKGLENIWKLFVVNVVLI